MASPEAAMITVQQAFARAFAHEGAGRQREARAIYEQILAAIPEHPGALLRIALGEAQEGRVERARDLLERAVRSAQSQALPAADIWLALGHVHLARADRLAAQRAFESACAAGPGAPDAYRILAWQALADGDPRRAEDVCRRGLAAFAGDVELRHLLGQALKALGNPAAARAVLVDAVAASNDPALLVSLGAVCLDLGLAAEARSHLEQAIARGQDTAQAWDNLGLAWRRLGDRTEATRAFERAVTRDPKFTPALANLISALRDQCRWDEAEPRERQWLEGLDDPAADPRRHPFLALSLATTPEQQKRIAREWSARTLSSASMPAVAGTRGTRLRVGYLSNQFHTHPMMYLTAGLFECHDRSRCEVFAYSYGPDDRSPIRQRVQAAIEHWVDVRAQDDDAVARRIREDGIDVLVEMVGHTEGGRLGIVTRRPAPVQIHYMGFPGTLGVPGIEAIVADGEIVPQGDERWFHERVLRMPITYMVTDNRRGLLPAPLRRDLGLADDALVLACFNQTYKLTRTFFAIWCEALRELSNAVLWLYVPVIECRPRIVAQAARLGVAAERIVFASRVEQDAHLARLQVADLALDVLPCGSHTTASDALWAGVPVLTCRGETFAGRVGASLLGAAGLPQLVTHSPDEYRAALLALGRDRTQVAAYKAHLVAERMRLALFDTEGFTRAWERLLEGEALRR